MHFLPPEDCALLLKTLGRTNNWHKHTRSYGDRKNKNIKKNTNDLTGYKPAMHLLGHSTDTEDTDILSFKVFRL